MKANAYTGMSLEEAKQILNIRDLNDLDTVAKVKTPCILTHVSILPCSLEL